MGWGGHTQSKQSCVHVWGLHHISIVFTHHVSDSNGIFAAFYKNKSQHLLINIDDVTYNTYNTSH